MAKDIELPQTSQRITQKISTLIIRAGLSSIPLAALVFDVGQAAVDLSNERITAKFLEKLSDRIDRIEKDQTSDRSNYKLGEEAAFVARESLNRLAMETSEQFASDLSRAVVELDTADKDPDTKRQFAIVISAIDKRKILYLSAIRRMNEDKANEFERVLLNNLKQLIDIQAGYELINATVVILEAHMPSISIEKDLESLQGLGLIRGPQSRIVGEKPEPKRIPYRVTEAGSAVLEMFYEDLDAIPGYSNLA